MDVKNLKSQVTYRIEPKEGGGFIARATDPAVPSLEALTREELQEKIRAQALDQVAAEFPELKGLLEHQLKSADLMKGKHSSSFVIRTTGNETSISEFSTREEKQEFAKEFGGLMNKNFPELSQALAQQNDGSAKATIAERGSPGINSQNTKPDDNPIPNTPIVPEASSRWPFAVVALSILATLIYFLLLHR